MMPQLTRNTLQPLDSCMHFDSRYKSIASTVQSTKQVVCVLCSHCKIFCGLKCSKCKLCLQGWYAAFGMIGVAAANNGKAKEAADLAAELVHMGWGVLVSHTFTKLSPVCLDKVWQLPFVHV